MLTLAWDNLSTTTEKTALVGFRDEEKDDDSSDPLSTLKHSIEQLQS